MQRYAHLEPITLKEAIQTLEPKVGFKLNFCHHTGTTSENKTKKEEILSSENS